MVRLHTSVSKGAIVRSNGVHCQGLAIVLGSEGSTKAKKEEAKDAEDLEDPKSNVHSVVVGHAVETALTSEGKGAGAEGRGVLVEEVCRADDKDDAMEDARHKVHVGGNDPKHA